MKKIASLLICIAMVLSLSVCAFALTGENYALFSNTSNVDIPTNAHIGGDANGDGVVNLVDVIITMRATVGDTSDASRDAIDMTGDGVVNIADVIILLRHIVGDEVGLGTVIE